MHRRGACAFPCDRGPEGGRKGLLEGTSWGQVPSPPLLPPLGPAPELAQTPGARPSPTLEAARSELGAHLAGGGGSVALPGLRKAAPVPSLRVEGTAGEGQVEGVRERGGLPAPSLGAPCRWTKS